MATIAELIEQYTAAYADLTAAALKELEHEDQKPVAKHAAIMRILGTQNAATGKPHTASSAELIVESESEYAAFLKSRREAVVAKMKARGEVDAAAFRVRAALALKGDAA